MRKIFIFNMLKSKILVSCQMAILNLLPSPSLLDILIYKVLKYKYFFLHKRIMHVMDFKTETTIKLGRVRTFF